MKQSIIIVIAMLIISSFVLVGIRGQENFKDNKNSSQIIANIKSTSVSFSNSELAIIPSNPPENILINETIPINVVFLGFNESLLDINGINTNLSHWYAPTIYRPLSYAGANYTFDFQYFLSNSTSLETDFIDYLDTIAVWNSAPVDLQNYDGSASGAFYIPAEETVSWLDNNINNYFGDINNSYTLYLIDTYTWSYITKYYYYTIDLPDPDTNMASTEKLTTLFGGKYPNRGVFLDLSAGPVNYEESRKSEYNEGVSADSITPIWEYSFPNDIDTFNTNLTEYIQETIELVFTPSYIYTPTIKNHFEVIVYIFDNTSSKNLYNNPLDYIDPNVIDSAFEKLIPYSSWNTSYFVDYLTNFPDLQQLIKNAYDLTNKTSNPNAIDHYQVIQYLDENRSLFGMTNNTIPVFFFAWDEYLYFGSESRLGAAEQDENGNPLLVLGGYNPALYPNIGYTTTVIHEVGHMLGLRHPHDGWSWDKLSKLGYATYVDWIRDFILTGSF